MFSAGLEKAKYEKGSAVEWRALSKLPDEVVGLL